jgi:hypothetical protein
MGISATSPPLTTISEVSSIWQGFRNASPELLFRLAEGDKFFQYMRYYLLPEKNGFKIMKVQADDVVLFQKRFAKEILFEAVSLGELLLQFASFLEKPSANG